MPQGAIPSSFSMPPVTMPQGAIPSSFSRPPMTMAPGSMPLGGNPFGTSMAPGSMPPAGNPFGTTMAPGSMAPAGNPFGTSMAPGSMPPGAFGSVAPGTMPMGSIPAPPQSRGPAMVPVASGAHMPRVSYRMLDEDEAKEFEEDPLPKDRDELIRYCQRQDEEIEELKMKAKQLRRTPCLKT